MNIPFSPPDITEEEIEAVSHILNEEMVHAAELKVPLIADVKQGSNWYEAK